MVLLFQVFGTGQGDYFRGDLELGIGVVEDAELVQGEIIAMVIHRIFGGIAVDFVSEGTDSESDGGSEEGSVIGLGSGIENCTDNELHGDTFISRNGERGPGQP